MKYVKREWNVENCYYCPAFIEAKTIKINDGLYGDYWNIGLCNYGPLKVITAYTGELYEAMVDQVEALKKKPIPDDCPLENKA